MPSRNDESVPVEAGGQGVTVSSRRGHGAERLRKLVGVGGPVRGDELDEGLGERGLTLGDLLLLGLLHLFVQI